MGLTSHYKLTTDITKPKEIRQVVEAIRQSALDLPFKEVGEVKEFRGDEADHDRTSKEDENLWLKIQAMGFTERGYRVKPLHIIAFSTWPGDGCEAANFGLCLYPATLEMEERGRTRRIVTKLDGWRWSSFCKTQYASDPDCGGVENFLRCHLCVVKLLDMIQAGGLVEIEVSDEGGYWQNRDFEALAKEVGNWNEFIAAFAGAIKDAAGKKGITVESAIAGFPNFERLEAKGQERWGDLRRVLGGEEEAEHEF